MGKIVSLIERFVIKPLICYWVSESWIVGLEKKKKLKIGTGCSRVSVGGY